MVIQLQRQICRLSWGLKHPECTREHGLRGKSSNHMIHDMQIRSLHQEVAQGGTNRVVISTFWKETLIMF
jgi:hypothetical protein